MQEVYIGCEHKVAQKECSNVNIHIISSYSFQYCCLWIMVHTKILTMVTKCKLVVGVMHCCQLQEKETWDLL